ncbi:putative replication initiator protein [Diporeia-associated CRESS-DNA virus LH481]|nr:putative replication initiator protein [Diporeia-associated CRESS-DNA virus LH481]
MTIKMQNGQGTYWILTIPRESFVPYLPPGIAYIKGQMEIGASGYNHWQIIAICDRSRRLSWIRSIFGNFHAELTRSVAAEQYVWKDETAVVGTRFELGSKPIRRNAKKDWDAIWSSACSGDILAIPSDVRIRCYSTLKRIRADYLEPVSMVRSCTVFWGPTGTGKSMRSWNEAGLQAYPKDPNTKFWCGYSGQEHVVIDEFRGKIDISHLLRWLDRYPVRVELKGASFPLMATKYWITSNLHPREWYPEIDAYTYDALERRLNIINIT